MGTATVELGVVPGDRTGLVGGTGTTTDTKPPPLLDELVGTLVDELLETAEKVATGGGAGTATGGTFEPESVKFTRPIPPGPNFIAAAEDVDWEIMVRV